MRTRWIIAAVLVIVGAVWIGQGLGLFRAPGSWTATCTWAVDRGGPGRRRDRRRLDRAQDAPPAGLSQRGPGRLGAADGHLVAVADQRQPEQPRVGQQPGDDPGVVEAAGRRGRRPGTGATSVEQRARRPSRSVKRRSSPGAIGALLEVDVVDDDRVARGRSGAPPASRPSRRARRPGCRASSWSASCRAGRAWPAA